DATAHGLRCLADRCAVDLPRPPAAAEPGNPVAPCPVSTRKRPPPSGLGIDFGTGWPRSRYPSDSGAWRLCVEGRLRLGAHLGAVARVDRPSGRDEATDPDGNGHDALSTGSITRITVLAGPSIVLANARLNGATRFLRLDLLGGYL